MFTLLAFIMMSTVAAVSPQLKERWIWETNPIIELCPDSEMSIKQAFNAIEYWATEGVHVDIQRVRRVEYCDPDKAQCHSGTRSH